VNWSGWSVDDFTKIVTSGDTLRPDHDRAQTCHLLSLCVIRRTAHMISKWSISSRRRQRRNLSLLSHYGDCCLSECVTLIWISFDFNRTIIWLIWTDNAVIIFRLTFWDDLTSYSSYMNKRFRCSLVISIIIRSTYISADTSLADGCNNLATGCYRWKFRGLISVQALRNFHMSWAATYVSNWLLQLALALYKHRSRRSVIHQLLSALF